MHSQLQMIFTEHSDNLAKAVEVALAARLDISAELGAFQSLLADPALERARAIFSTEVLARLLKKEGDFTTFVEALLSYIDRIIHTDASLYKNSIFILRCCRTLINTRFYIPLPYYLTKVAGDAVAQKKLVRSGKTYSYENVRLSSDDLKAEELQVFVVGEALRLVRQHCERFGNSIGFPELAFVVCNDLRRNCKEGVFREVVGALIARLTARKEYIEAERTKLRAEGLRGKEVAAFESELAPWDE